jgi:two-component system alkaline phosphatase synthesis response regulator PhoP
VPKIFIVEDNADIRDMVLYALESAGFAAEGFADGEALRARPGEDAPSLILLDIMLPGEDGISILKRLRQSDKYGKIPVIMLTAKTSELDRIRGLDLGADDYITKPFSVMEVISRIRAVLRRYGGDAPGGSVARIGGVALDRDRRSVSADGAAVALTFKEFELLSCLMANEGIVLTRDSLLDNVWGFNYGGESRTVDMHIKSLRQKLGGCGELIKTVRNVGYKMGG